MDPSAFEFSLSMPGDARLVGAVRGLAAHAAAYAQLDAGAAAGLARQVEAAIEAAIAASGAQDVPVDVRFVREAGTLTISIGLDVDAAATWPPSAEAGLTVEASRAGTRETCRITQRLA